MLSRTADHLFWMSRYTERAENTARNPKWHREFRQHTTARKSGGRKLHYLNRLRKAASIAGAARISGQLDPPATGDHRLCQGLRRKHMPAGAARSDQQ